MRSYSTSDGGLGDELEVMSYFDWLSPLWVLFRNLLSGPTHTILIPRDVDGVSFGGIRALLKSNGVTSWNYMLMLGSLMVTVRRRDALRAQWALDENGIPITGRRVPGVYRPPAGMLGSPQSVSGKRSARGNSVTRYLFGG